VSSFTELWQRRERAARELLHAERAVETYVNDEDAAAYEDIFGVPRNRLRFDDFEGMAQQSTSAREATSAASTTPCWGNHWVAAPRALRPCRPGCTCTCVPCTLKRMGPPAHAGTHEPI